MQKKKIRQFVEQDKLREALDELAKGLPEEASLLKGRLTNKDTQWLRGSLSREDYSIERNQLRQAILRLLDGMGEPSTSNPLKWLVIGLIFVGALSFGIYQFYFATPQQAIENTEEGTTQVPETNGSTDKHQQEPGETKATTDLSESLKEWIDQQATIQGEVTDYPLSVTKEYKVGLAYLKRKFTWLADFPFSMDPASILTRQDSEKGQYRIQVPLVTLNTKFHLREQRASTLSNSLWAEERSMDGDFWEQANQVSVEQANTLFTNRNSWRSQVQQQAARNVTEMIRQQLAVLGEPSANIVVQVQQLRLFNGSVIDL